MEMCVFVYKILFLHCMFFIWSKLESLDLYWKILRFQAGWGVLVRGSASLIVRIEIGVGTIYLQIDWGYL